jgi:hypothetical protein
VVFWGARCAAWPVVKVLPKKKTKKKETSTQKAVQPPGPASCAKMTLGIIVGT